METDNMTARRTEQEPKGISDKQTVMVQMPRSLVETLDRVAQGESRSIVIRRACREFVQTQAQNQR